MKPNFEEARKRIDNSGVCDEYKQFAHDVLDGLEGKERKPKPKTGQVWRYEGKFGCYVGFLVCVEGEFCLVDLDNGHFISTTEEDIDSVKRTSLLADNLQSYFEKKARGEL